MKYSIFLFLPFLFLLSCNSSTSVDELSESEISSLPLQVGNSWHYSVTMTRNITGETESDSVIFTVVSDTLVNGVQWYRIGSDHHIHNRLVGGFYSNQKDGIYQTWSLSENPQKLTIPSKTRSRSNGNNLMINQLSNNSTGATNEFLFLHNPDTEITERLLKNDYFIGSVNYIGVKAESLLNIETKAYTREYYQFFDGNRKYGVEPAQLNYEISNQIGFVVFESAYYSFSTSEENDERLSLSHLYRYELIEYSVK